MNFLNIIKPIRLLKGSHKETDAMGSGCMMNVISYLQNESVITDAPGGVDSMIRNVCISINDFMEDGERQQLTPFVFRAMNTATEDRKVWQRRNKIIDRYCYEIMTMMAHWCQKHEQAEHLYREFGQMAALCCRSPLDLFRAYMQKAYHLSYDLGVVAVVPPMPIIPIWDDAQLMNATYTVTYVGSNDRHKEHVKLLLAMLDELLPEEVDEPAPCIITRATELRSLAREHGNLVTV